MMNPLRHFPNTRGRRQAGAGLIEIMVAMVAGLILIGGVIQIYVSSKQSYRINEGLSRLQENSRFALEFLAHELRLADYRDLPTDGHFEEVEGSSWPAFIQACDEGDEDCDLVNVNNALVNVAEGDVIAITYEGQQDCLSQDVPIAGKAPIAVDRVVTNVYYLQDGDLKCLGNGNSSNPQPLAEGVGTLQILYGEDSDNDLMADRYLPASDPNLDMQDVVSVRLFLLAQTDDNISPVAESYNFMGETQSPPDDHRLRREFTTTVNLRNRVK